MKLLLHISRLFVGSLFIVSGLIKANDALGFSYKLHEYFEPEVLNLPFLMDLALPMAIAICVAEIVLGVFVLIGYKPKSSSWLLLAMIIGFTFLTFYSAYFNKVTDCGCFGDAIKLTPWQSFTKDLILLFFILIIFIKRNTIDPFSNVLGDVIYTALSLALITWFSVSQLGWVFPVVFTAILLLIHIAVKLFGNTQAPSIAAISTLVLSTFFSLYCYSNLPVKDFRPYAIGKSISEQMTLPENAKLPVIEYGLIYKNKDSGEEKRFTVKNLPSKANWDFVKQDNKIISKGDEAKIPDFSLNSYEDGNDYTEDILNEEKILLVIIYDVKKAEKNFSGKLNNLITEANSNGYYVYGVSASSFEELEKFRHENQLAIDFLSADGIVLKTMIRSTPGIMLLNKGTVLGKWASNSIPEYSEIQSLNQ